MSQYDLLVIGGGINGLGIAADAASRGFSVLLVEKGDYGGGTTAASSRLIHGGLRYLQYGELGLVQEALRERGLLLRQRPHLVRAIDLLIPVFRGLPPPGWMVGTGLRLYDLLARDPDFPRARSLAAGAVREREPGLAREGLAGGYLYGDGQVEFPERLCVELARESRDAGAERRTHTRVTSLVEESGRVTGAEFRDELTGETRSVAARLTINAAGPWVDVVNRLLPRPPPRLIGGTWGTHLVLPAREGGPRGPLYAAARKDGRPFFLLPWDGRLLVGTTDVRFEGDPDRLQVQEWEIDYLLAETNRLFPSAAYSPADVEWTTIGVRPLPAAEREAGAITRRHFLVDHRSRHGIEGLVSVVGGKLTTFRSLAEGVVDHAARALGAAATPCRTRTARDGVPPEELEAAARADLRPLNLPSEYARRLVRLYGPRYGEVLELIRRDRRLGAPLADGCPARAAEVIQALEREDARTVEDVLLRRLMLLPPSAAARSRVEQLYARHPCRGTGA